MAKIELELNASALIKQAMLKMMIGTDKISKAPVETKRHGEHYEFLIGIGKDETAYITMTKEAYEELMRNGG